MFDALSDVDADWFTINAVENRLSLDPVLLGSYPNDAIGRLGGMLRADPATFEALVLDGDLDITSAPNDFLAVG